MTTTNATRLIASLLTLISARPGLLISYPVLRRAGWTGSRADFLTLAPLAAVEANNQGVIAYWRKDLEVLEVYSGRWTTTKPGTWEARGAEYAEEMLSRLLASWPTGHQIGDVAALLLDTWTQRDLAHAFEGKVSHLEDLRGAAERRLWMGFKARMQSFETARQEGRAVAA